MFTQNTLFLHLDAMQPCHACDMTAASHSTVYVRRVIVILSPHAKPLFLAQKRPGSPPSNTKCEESEGAEQTATESSNGDLLYSSFVLPKLDTILLWLDFDTFSARYEYALS